MPFPDPLLPIALIAVLASGVSMLAFNLCSSTSAKIRETHTRFALTQIAGRLDEIDGANLPTTKTDLLSVLQVSNIDWNSCELNGGEILDGWGQMMATTFDASSRTWTFRSPGRDSEMGTSDDIKVTAPGNDPGEQGADAKPDNVTS